MTQSTTGIYRMEINTTPMQNIGGANRSVTNNKQILQHFQQIEPYRMNGVNGNIICTGKGLIPWRSEEGIYIMIPCYYTKDISITILSPTDLVTYHKVLYNGWTMAFDVDEGMGEFKLMARDGVSHLSFSTYIHNNLWYHYYTTKHDLDSDESHPHIMALTDGAEHELWHHRLGHPGSKVTEKIHDLVEGVPHLRPNQFYCCAACMIGKFQNNHIGPIKEGSIQHVLKQLPASLREQVKKHLNTAETQSTKDQSNNIRQHKTTFTVTK